MLVPLEWLRGYADPPLDTGELAARLTLTGTQVERSFRHGPPSGERYVVGRVLEAVQHPNADRLRVCTVDVGDGEPATIVCGAPNVSGGQTVAVARPGAQMADGRTLGAAKLRGVLSEGMILATDEIALGGDHSGILVLDEGPAPGTPLAQVLPLGTDVLELEVTPNRPDCLSIYGVAREVHAATGAPLAPPPWAHDPGTLDGEPPGIAIAVECPDLCPRFTARVFEEVRPGPSPLWLVARLLAAGMRPISNVVDITNYVMLLTGQPLHAFDLDRVGGGALTVRRARVGETIETLDGETRTLAEAMVVIADADGPTSLAGVMGGGRSEVGEGTTRVLLEAASWDGATVQRTGLALGLRSEASHRFEKGLSRLSPLEGQAVASALLVELCGARLLPGTVDVGGPGEPSPPISLRPRRVEALLGTAIPAERCAAILDSLGFETEPGRETIAVAVPSWRSADVTREVDLIEEVARIDGLDRLPATLPPRSGVTGRLSHSQRVRRRAEDALAARGVSEIAGWSFADPALGDRLRLPEEHPMRRTVAIANALSEAQSVLRPTLLGPLLDAAAHNTARGVADLALFESGTVFRGSASGTGSEEHQGLCVLLTGALPGSWRDGPPAAADFYAAKGLLEALLGVLAVPFAVAAAEEPFLHPGRGAAVIAAGERIGFLGELHPLVCESWGLERAAAWGLDLGSVAALAPELIAFESFGEYPVVREDIAVVVAEGTEAAAVIAAVRGAGGRELDRVEVFDVYRGAQVGEGQVSLALHLEFRSLERTLTDEDVAQARERIASELERRLGASIRGASGAA
jgi:phenylalanyl-tRNA synthetase beta chain